MTDFVLIVGASSDLGLALIDSLGDEQMIVAHYNSSDAALNERIANGRAKLIPVQADFSVEGDLERFLDHVADQYGVPTKIVHLSAPKFDYQRFRDLQWAPFMEELEISLKSLVLTANRFLPQLAKQKRGKLVCVLSSVTLGVPPKSLVQYTTVKYAMLGLIKSLASEYADKNLQINAVSPSMIETKFLDKLNEKFIELSAHNHPLKRNAMASDVVPLIEMLLSDDSGFVTGVNLPVTGGVVY